MSSVFLRVAPYYIVLDTGGEPRKLMKTEIAKRVNGPSPMPPTGTILTRREIRDVVAYLSMLK
jgi:mono/diheme cytochrome c family protein